jgi:hypothetical protein
MGKLRAFFSRLNAPLLSRALARNRPSAVIAILTPAPGIGANTNPQVRMKNNGH